MLCCRYALDRMADDSSIVFISVNPRGPFGRQATGWEIAYAVLFFLSEESVFIHAQTLAVDAGVTGL